MNTREVGRLGEEAALRFLQKQGYRLITRNFYCPYGELDLIMQRGRQLVFVEVKARTSTRFGTPEEAISSQKLRRLRQAISCYLQQEAPPHYGLRLDVIAVDFEPHTYRVKALRHYENIG
ncbi:MAG: YraN family protein [Firmicutes bacterium]|nr:YraN family protein [Bacillota bacterium]